MEKEIHNSHGASPVNQNIWSMWWIRTSRLSINNPLSLLTMLASMKGAHCVSSMVPRRHWVVPNRATLPQKWPPPPSNVAGSCQWTQRLNQRKTKAVLFREGMRIQGGEGYVLRLLASMKGAHCVSRIVPCTQHTMLQGYLAYKKHPPT